MAFDPATRVLGERDRRRHAMLAGVDV